MDVTIAALDEAASPTAVVEPNLSPLAQTSAAAAPAGATGALAGVPVEPSPPPDTTALPPPPTQPAVQIPKQQALDLIDRAQNLPPTIREQLTAAIRATASQSAANEPQVPLAAVIAAVEQSLPAYLRGSPAGEAAAHPTGDAFFSGAAGELTDSEAEALAHQQLERAGLLRNQRVRA